MKRKRFLVGFAVLVMTLGSGTMANEIYKWTDADGNVHYEDRPTGVEAEEVVAVTYRRTSGSDVQQRIDSQNEGHKARQEARAVAAEAEKAAEAEAVEAAEKQKRCDTYRARLETYVQSRRLYREDDSGERVYLDETQTQEARRRVEELIAENCSS
ncbi:MAG: DUF4124 domain-containing protein [Woeseiaceae bacterium]